MFSKGKSLPLFSNQILRILIAAIFLIGILPVPALAVGNGTIAGQVTNNITSSPVDGAMIQVFPSGSLTPGWNGNSNVSGNYSVAVPAGSNYQVAAMKEGFVTRRVSGQNVTDNAITVINFFLNPGGIIRGTVSNNASVPIQNANVRAFLAASPGVSYDSLSTSASGNFSLTVPPGPGYTVEASMQGFATANQTGISANLSAPVVVNFTLVPTQSPDTTPPANITDLSTSNATQDSVRLTWTAPGDDDITGQAAQYDIRYAASSINNTTAWNNAQPAANVTLPHVSGSTEGYMVTGLSANTTYFFAIKTRDDADLWSGLSNSPSATTTPPQPTPSINIAHISGKSAFTLGAGDNITEIFNITSVNNFTGIVQLLFGGAPPGMQANSNINPSQVSLSAGETRSVTLTLSASAETPSGTYPCMLVGQATGIQPRGYGFAVNVGVAGMPLLWSSPAMVASGNQTTFFVSKFAPSANITLKWDSGPHVGVVMATGQTSVNGTWNSPAVTIPADMPNGNFAVKAISGSSSAVYNLNVTSGSGPDFIMTVSPQSISIAPGGSSNVTIGINSVNGFNAAVVLTSGSPPGITWSLSTNNVTPSTGQAASATLTINVAEWASPAMYHINVGGACTNPPINKMMDISLNIQSLGQWGPSISLSQSYGVGGDSITITGANFPERCYTKTVTIIEAVTSANVTTTPSIITVNNSGGFTGTFTIPPIVSSGNYRFKAIVALTGDFAERDFQILGAGEKFTLGISPESTTVTTAQGQNSATVSVNIFSIGGNSPAVNLALEGVPPWLTYQFGTLPPNTAASGNNSISVPAGGSTSCNLALTTNMTSPTGTYPMTVKGWETGSPERRVSLQLTVQPPAGFGMAEFTLSPAFGEVGRTVNFSGSGFTSCNISQVTELKFGGLNILSLQSLPPITVPTSGDAAGRFSGTFRVPSALSPGTYPVEIRVGSAPYDKFISKPFTITGGNDTFVLQASPSFLWVEQGGQIHSMIQVQSTGSSSPTVILSLEGYPSNDIIASLSSNNATAPPGGTASTDLTLNAQSWLPAGHYTITVKGQLSGGAEVHRIPLEMSVAPPAGSGMASIYLSPTSGYPGAWVTLSGSGFLPSANVTHLYVGPPNAQNDWVSRLPAIVTSGSGAFTAVLQVPASLPAGMYPVEVVVGTYPNDRRASAQFTLVSSGASFNINLSPMMIQAAPGTSISTSLNIQSVGASATNVTIRVEGPPTIEWRFDGGAWQTPKTVFPAIGSTLVSSLEIQPRASTPMGHYSLAVKATAGNQTEMRNLELDVGASSAYSMPILSLNPNTGTAGTNVAFSGSNFPPNTQVTGITFSAGSITLAQAITTSPQGSFSGAFTVPGTVGGQPIAPGTYVVRVYVGPALSDAQFYVYGSDDTFMVSLSPSFLQGSPGTEPRTSGLLKALGGASPTVKMAVRGLPPGVQTNWNGIVRPTSNISAPPGGQNNFELGLVLPNMLAMGQYPAVLESWVDTNLNDAWDSGEKITRINLELSIMPPQGYNMGMLSLNPTFGRVGDNITIAGSGFSANTTVQSLTFAQRNVLTNNITTSADGSFSGIFTVPAPTGPGRYTVDVVVGTPPNDRIGHFEFQVISSNQKFSVSASPGWLARPAGETASVSISVRSLVTNPPSPTVIITVEGLPMGVTPSFTSTNVTPAVGNMEGRELRLNISNGTPMGNYPISVRAYNAATPSEEMWTNFTLEVTPSSGFMNMGMAMVTISPNFGSVGSQITVSGYGFPQSQSLTSIRLGPALVTPNVATTTDASGAFSAVITVPYLPSGPHPVEVNVQNTIRMTPFNIMGANDTFSINISPNWLEPIPAGDPAGRQIAITITALPGQTPSVSLRTEGLFAAYGTITQVWNPTSRSVNVTSAGGAATATLTLIPSENLPPGPYPFNIVAVDGSSNRRDFHMEFHVGPPANFMNTDWMTQQGVFFPDIFLSPMNGPAGTQVTYTGTNLPASANVTSINFAGNPVPLPPGGITADGSGGFSGSFIVSENWSLSAGGKYFVNFHLVKDTWWQDIGRDFNLMRNNASFSLEATPNWIPPIPPQGFGQTRINVKALSYNSVNVTLGVMETFGGMGVPGGAQPHWVTQNGTATGNVTVAGGSQTSTDFYLQGANPGHYMITIVGWIDSNNNQVLEPNIPSEAESAFPVPLDFDVQPPQGFKDWNKQETMASMNMMNNMNMTAANDMYLFYFPEIVLGPNMGPADTKVTINATDFPAGANVTRFRFAGQDLPIPSGTAADSSGEFTLVFNIPRTMWEVNTRSGWYNVEVEAQKSGEPPVHIVKPFQVTAPDDGFTLKADPDWLPPISPSGNATTLIRVKSMGSAADVTLSADRMPPGITASFSAPQVNVSPGGSGSSVLTLTPTTIPPGHYGAEIKGTATIGVNLKTIFAHIEFDVQPATMFKDTGWMQLQNIWFPEITLNPAAGPVKTKVNINATDFPAGANITHLRFAGRELPIAANTTADSEGNANLVFNVPGDFGVGQYMVEVEAQKADRPQVFIAKPFFIENAGVTFKLNVVPGFVPGVPQGSSGNTTVFVQATGRAVTVQLYVDGLPPGVDGTFDNITLTVAPGSSSNTRLTITTRASTAPGQYPLTIRGVSGGETRMAPFGFGIMPPANFQVPKLTLNPEYAPAGYTDKQYKITFSGNGFPVNRSVTSLTFGRRSVAIPANLMTDAYGNFNGVFQMPIGLDPGTYDVRVAVADGRGYVYDSRPFSIRGAQAKFMLKTSPPYLPPVLQGGQGTAMVNVQSVGTSAANVTLYVDGLAPGITATFTPSNTVNITPGISSSATLTLSVANSTAPGPYPMNIRGVSGNETVGMPFGFGVMPNLGAGEGGHATVTINPAQARPGEHIGVSGAGFTSNSTITLTAAPPGAATSNNITPPGAIQVQSDGTWATEITVPAADQVPPGTYIIKASDGVMASKNIFSIVPASDADFFLTVSPQFIDVIKGQSGNTTMKLSSKNGFKDPVVFRVGHLVPGVTATFKNADGNTIGQFAGAPGGIREIVAPVGQTPVPGEDTIITVLIDVDVATPIGPCDIGLGAGFGTVFRSIPLGLQVISAGTNIGISPQSGPADTDINISGSGFTAGEAIAITFAGSNITTVPAAINASQGGTFTAVITAPSMNAGIYPVRVSGRTSGITIDRPFSLRPSRVDAFVLYTSPMKVDTPKGGSGTVTIKIEPLGRFQSAVALSVSGLNAVSGATANISPSATITPSIATPTTATLTINVPDDATVGKYTLVITGTSGAITQTRTITLNVVPPSGTRDFGINLTPNTIPVSANSSSNTTVTVSAINEFTGTVDLSVTMSNPSAAWPASISCTAANVTPSTATGLGKQAIIFTASADTQPGTWTFRVTGTSGALSHSTDVMVICTPSGTTVTTYDSPRLDPTTVTESTPIDMTSPWGDRIIINGIINDGAEASIITPSKVNVPPNTLADLPAGATDMLGRVTNVDSSSPVDSVEWDIGFPYDPAQLAAAGLEEENLKVAYLNPDTGNWTTVTTRIDTTNKMAYASPSHFSSWTLIATPAPPPSEVVTQYPGGGGGGGATGTTSLAEYITVTGRFIVAATAQSADGIVTLNIPKETTGKNKMGQPLYAVTIRPQDAPEPAPADTRFVSLVYDLGPNGATFDPPVKLTFGYSDSQLPAGVAEKNMVVATWQDGKWVDIEGSTIDPVANTITVPVSHFTVFTVMAHTAAASFEITSLNVTPEVINPDESVTISATIANQGYLAGSHKVTLKVNDSVTATEEVSLAGRSSQKVTFTFRTDKAGTYTLDVDGLKTTLTVKEVSTPAVKEPAPSVVTPPEIKPAPPVPAEVQPLPSEVTQAPPEIAPAVPETPVVPQVQRTVPSRINDWLIFLVAVAAGAVIIGLVYWRKRAGRRAS